MHKIWNLNFGKVRPLTSELAATEWLNIFSLNMMGKWCLHFFSAVFDLVTFIIADNKPI